MTEHAATPDITQPDPAPVPASAAGVPVDSAERIVTLDFIRGIAVLGILFPNIVAFGQPLMSYFWPQALAGGMTEADGLFWWFQFTFVDGKFRGLFSLLFGAGIYLFMERAWARGAGRGLQVRRLLILLAFGLIHFFLIWRGDILTVYAAWGLVALLMIRWQARTQLIAGIVVSLAGGLMLASLMGMQYVGATSPAAAAQMGPVAAKELADQPGKVMRDAVEETRVFSTGSYGDIVSRTAAKDAHMVAEGILVVGPFETIGLMLLGMALYRYGLFAGRLDHAKMRRWGWIGVTGGCALAALAGWWPWSQDFPFWATMLTFQGLGALPQLATVLGLASLLSLWAPTAARGWLGRRFVAVGRMAFSNYLGTSILMMFVFNGWAGGLFGQLHRPQLFLVVLAAWALMLVWSPLWLARFRYGPLEWLWRCLTYGRLFPLRRAA